MQVIWTDYFKYRVKLRGFSLVNIEEILRYSTERYYDCATDRLVVVGNDAKTMVLIPYEKAVGRLLRQLQCMPPIGSRSTTG